MSIYIKSVYDNSPFLVHNEENKEENGNEGKDEDHNNDDGDVTAHIQNVTECLKETSIPNMTIFRNVSKEQQLLALHDESGVKSNGSCVGVRTIF